MRKYEVLIIGDPVRELERFNIRAATKSDALSQFFEHLAAYESTAPAYKPGDFCVARLAIGRTRLAAVVISKEARCG